MGRPARLEDGHAESGCQEVVDSDFGLPHNGPECSFRHVARMVRDGGVKPGRSIEPDLVTARGLAVELEAQRLQLANDVSVTEYRKPTPVQAATTMVWFRRSVVLGRFGMPSRSRCASSSFRATSRAISRASVTVRP